MGTKFFNIQRKIWVVPKQASLARISFQQLEQASHWFLTCQFNTLSYFFDSSIVGESSGRHMETIQASEPSTLDMVAGTDKDEVQVRKLPKLSFLSGC